MIFVLVIFESMAFYQKRHYKLSLHYEMFLISVDLVEWKIVWYHPTHLFHIHIRLFLMNSFNYRKINIFITIDI